MPEIPLSITNNGIGEEGSALEIQKAELKTAAKMQDYQSYLRYSADKICSAGN